jgi:hypothetical protein
MTNPDSQKFSISFFSIWAVAAASEVDGTVECERFRVYLEIAYR